jgi:cytochrome P450
MTAGSDTTQYMLRWVLLLMANDTQMQRRMRDEVENNIGDRMATHEDMKSCAFVNAFIAEALRFRGVAPLSVPHRAMTDYKLG